MTRNDLIEKLSSWLAKRGEPDSGIRYETGSHSNTNGIRHRLSSVTLHGSDADFVAKHFHGQGARDLASAIRTALDLSPLTERIERLEGALHRGRDLLGALQKYGFPVSDAAVRALVDGGSIEAQAVHVAALAFKERIARTLSETQP